MKGIGNGTAKEQALRSLKVLENNYKSRIPLERTIDSHLKRKDGEFITEEKKQYLSKVAGERLLNCRVCQIALAALVQVVDMPKDDIFKGSLAVLRRDIEFLTKIYSMTVNNRVKESAYGLIISYGRSIRTDLNYLDLDITSYFLYASAYKTHYDVLIMAGVSVLEDIVHNTSLGSGKDKVGYLKQGEYDKKVTQVALEYKKYLQRQIQMYVELNGEQLEHLAFGMSQKFRVDSELDAAKMDKMVIKEQSKVKDKAGINKQSYDYKLKGMLQMLQKYMHVALTNDNSDMYFDVDEWNSFKREIERTCGDADGIEFGVLLIMQNFSSGPRIYFRNKAGGEMLDCLEVNEMRSNRLGAAQVMNLGVIHTYKDDGTPVLRNADKEQMFMISEDKDSMATMFVGYYINKKNLIKGFVKRSGYEYSKGIRNDLYQKMIKYGGFKNEK